MHLIYFPYFSFHLFRYVDDDYDDAFRFILVLLDLLTCGGYMGTYNMDATMRWYAEIDNIELIHFFKLLFFMC